MRGLLVSAGGAAGGPSILHRMDRHEDGRGEVEQVALGARASHEAGRHRGGHQLVVQRHQGAGDGHAPAAGHTEDGGGPV